MKTIAHHLSRPKSHILCGLIPVKKNTLIQRCYEKPSLSFKSLMILSLSTVSLTPDDANLICLNFSTGALGLTCLFLSFSLVSRFVFSFFPLLFSFLHFISRFIFHLFFHCSVYPGMRFVGMAVVAHSVVFCEHNPSVSKQGDLAYGFPFCISLRPWKFCVSGTTPWVPKFKNLHKAQEWSVLSFTAVHTCYNEKCCWMKMKHYFGNHYCMRGSDLCLAVRTTVLLSLSHVLMKLFWCVWRFYTTCSTCWITKIINDVCLVTFYCTCQMKTINMP